MTCKGAPKGYTLFKSLQKSQKRNIRIEQETARYAGFKTRTIRDGDIERIYIKKR
jgi:hypothetical protein